MVSEIELFRYRDVQVRTVVIDGEPWFVAADVASVLGFRMASDALRTLDDDERGTHIVRTPGGDQQVSVVNEPGLYSLILRSRKPEAKAFKRWITHEVLPQIRRTGAYSPAPAIPQTLSEALRLAADEHDRANAAEQRVAELEPKAAAVDALTDVGGALKIGAVANMYGIGRTSLFRILYAEQILQRDRRPYQRYADWFRVVMTTHESGGREVADYTSYIWPAAAARLHALLTRRGYTLSPLPEQRHLAVAATTNRAGA